MASTEATADGVHVVLTEELLSEPELAAVVRGPDTGGVVSFRGDVRADREGDRIVDHIVYEAYVDMALRRLHEIGLSARANWPGMRVAIAHRLGRVAVGETSVIVVAASPHRAEAFEACAWVMDRLKAEVPIWKREVFPS